MLLFEMIIIEPEQVGQVGKAPASEDEILIEIVPDDVEARIGELALE